MYISKNKAHKSSIPRRIKLTVKNQKLLPCVSSNLRFSRLPGTQFPVSMLHSVNCAAISHLHSVIFNFQLLRSRHDSGTYIVYFLENRKKNSSTSNKKESYFCYKSIGKKGIYKTHLKV